MPGRISRPRYATAVRAGRSLAAAVLLAGLAACTGGTAPEEPAARERSAAPTPGGIPGEPAAQVTVGTDVEGGVLARWCTRGDCTRTAGAVPARYLRAEDTRLAVFALAVRPDRVSVVVRHERRGVAERARLKPGTLTPVYTADVPPGRYVLVLRAWWKGQEARWLFGLRVPPD